MIVVKVSPPVRDLRVTPLRECTAPGHFLASDQPVSCFEITFALEGVTTTGVDHRDPDHDRVSWLTLGKRRYGKAVRSMRATEFPIPTEAGRGPLRIIFEYH